MPSVKTIREQARQIINSDLITHIGAMLFIAVCMQSIIYTGNTLSLPVTSFANERTAYLVMFAFVFFAVAITVPLVYGFCVFESNCAATGRADFSDMFCGFGSLYSYLRSFRFVYAFLWRFVLVFLLPIYIMSEFSLYKSKSSYIPQISVAGFDLTYTAFVILIIVTLFISVIIYSKFILAAYLCCTDEEAGISDCFLASDFYMKKCKEEQFKLALSFLPLMLLNVISCGITLVYTLPYMFMSFFVFAHQRYINKKLDYLTASELFAKNNNI